jgi:serine/threonine protein kinase
MERLGKYEMRGKLGDGSTSVVWLAYDPFAQRQVAIKQILPEVLRDKTRGRLYRNLLINEASLAGKLVHPHIAQIFDAVVDGDEAYIVMEYVPGGTLEQHTSREALLAVERVVELMFKCTRALEHAFQSGVTHRDIKPANILLTEDGDIKISDFGAALLTSNDRTQVSGIGSPAYMSPQQVREMPLNHQTDIYSLGVVMYQLLAGQLPFMATNNYSMIYQITHVEPPPPSAYRPGIPASLDAIVARAMQKTLDMRYAGWAEFSHDLAQAFRNRALAPRERDPSENERMHLLRSLGFFDDFSDVELWEVVRLARVEPVGSGTRIFKDGDTGDYFYILAEGEVVISKRGCMLAMLAAGDSFGELAIVARDQPMHSADAMAHTASTLIRIGGDALRNASEACRMRFYHAFLRSLAVRLNYANERIVGMMVGE